MSQDVPWLQNNLWLRETPWGPRHTLTFPTLGTQVLSDVVMHTHVLLQHIFSGKGLATLLTSMAFHTCKQTQQCWKALASKRSQLEAQ